MLNTRGGNVVVYFLVCLVIAGAFYLRFTSVVSELQRELATSRERIAEYKEHTERLLQVKEESLKHEVSQELQRSLDSSFSKLSGHVTAIEQELTSQKQQLESTKTKLLSDSLSKINELFQSFVAVAAQNQQQQQQHQSPSSGSLPAPTNPAIVKGEYINEKWKPTRGFKPVKTSDKWIVMTSINLPTDSVKKLCSLKGWATVVVGDLKTNPKWEYNNCKYLGVEEQNGLPYRTVKYLPYNSYTRKNIGYLYAIEHGAKVILDTDDDNEPFGESIRVLPSEAKLKALVRPDASEDRPLSNVVNPYSYFGRPDVWPRGYPLQAVNVSEEQEVRTIKTIRAAPYVQQGLADLDPDVDAIFRLTRPDALPHVEFDADQDPIVIAPGTLCPFNSQNTIFHYNAFWGLILPTTVNFRLTDIWRGYWAQRLLWDIGGALSFLPPTVKQIRNAHNYLDDFEDEIPMYLTTNTFISLLLDFEKPSASDTLFKRILTLANRIEAAGLWKRHDVVVLEAWLQDLRDAGYQSPSLISS
eukprot:TRINITY_DN8121_c0_g3_i2.p1 TRINITY_DN8121_c0_g3~~TRINITY_DN8121_c0_g3_i2.p1  ORF type:complete len:527 (-),score=138.73 TRINITY_DN8121_c0_g3_i2:59-1639(-)